MRRLIAVASVTALLALSPFAASALSTDQIQQQIATLLAQVTSLQQLLATLTPVATTSVTAITPAVSAPAAVPAATSTTGVTCPVFNFTFGRGSQGDAVTALQKFLVARGFLTNDSVTGFYGALTESAVQNFQAAQGIVSSGTPATTGWGVIGKKTSAAIVQVCSAVLTSPPVTVSPTASMCTAIALSCPTGERDQVGPNCSHSCVTGSSALCPSAPPPTSACSTGWQSNTDTNGCIYSYSCTTSTSTPASSCPVYQTPTCNSGYSLVQNPVGANGCAAGYQCVLASFLSSSVQSCPSSAAPSCVNGTLIPQGIDSNNCQLPPLCVGNE